MRTFKDKESGKVIGLSLKVMYSWFKRNQRFEEISGLTPDIFLCRNPFERVVSMFFDKCRARTDETAFHQDCQTVLIKHLGLTHKKELKDISFHDFIVVLPQIIYLDEHFWPQNRGFHGAPEIFNIQDLSVLANKLSLDFSHKENATKHKFFTDYAWDSDTAVVQHLYIEDIKTLPC